MLELIITACLLTEPTKCREESLVYQVDNLTPYQCMMKSPIEIAKWQEYRPRWFAKRWTCRPAGRFQKV